MRLTEEEKELSNYKKSKALEKRKDLRASKGS
jgi:hypothetical protein